MPKFHRPLANEQDKVHVVNLCGCVHHNMLVAHMDDGVDNTDRVILTFSNYPKHIHVRTCVLKRETSVQETMCVCVCVRVCV
jgi:hypothetical protein